MGIDKTDPDIFENAVASLVDVSSILFAYQIGVENFSILFGLMYAAFDAFLVVWMRKPIYRFVRWANPIRVMAVQKQKRKEQARQTTMQPEVHPDTGAGVAPEPIAPMVQPEVSVHHSLLPIPMGMMSMAQPAMAPPAGVATAQATAEEPKAAAS